MESGSSKLVINGSAIYAEGGTGPAVEAQSAATELQVSAHLRNTIAIHDRKVNRGGT